MKPDVFLPLPGVSQIYAHCSIKLHLEGQLKERKNIRKIRFLAYGLESLNLPALSLKNFRGKSLFLHQQNEDFLV